MYKDATVFFSQDSAVTIANVVPTMDRINAMLSSSARAPFAPGVKHALTFARQLMDKYYSKTDLSNVYRIAMGMSRSSHTHSILPNQGDCHVLWHNTHVCSAPPSTQAQVLSAARMGEGVDQNS
jgi:hypothetical protein